MPESTLRSSRYFVLRVILVLLLLGMVRDVRPALAVNPQLPKVLTLLKEAQEASLSGNNGLAAAKYQQAYSTAQARGDKRGMTEACLGRGNVYKDTGSPKQALECYEQAGNIAHETGNKKGEADALVGFGTVNAETNQPDQALKYFNAALPMFQAVGDQYGEANALYGIADVCDGMGKPTEALKYYHMALPIFHAIDNKHGEGDTLNSIGLASLHIKNFEDALNFWKQANDFYDTTKDIGGKACVLANLGAVCSATQRPDEALRNYQDALTIFKDIGDTASAAGIFNNIGNVEANQKHFDTAAQNYDQALALTEQYRANLGGYSEAKSRYLQSMLFMYYNALRVHLQLHDEQRAFALAQQTKARNLLDLMEYGRVDLSHDLTPAERRQLQEIKQQSDLLNQAMVREGVINEVGAMNRFKVLQQKLKDTEDGLQTLTEKIYAAHPALAEKTAATTATLEQTAAALPADTALLEYVITSKTQVTLFVVRQEQGQPIVKTFTLLLVYADLVARTAQFHAACANPTDADAYKKPAVQLYIDLLAKAAKASLEGVKHLVICPDQTLWEVPFAALLLPDNGTFLAEHYEISYAYSATGLLAAQKLSNRNRPAPKRSLLALADPDFGTIKRFGDLNDLPGQRPFDAPSRPFDAPSRPFDAPSRPFEAPSRPIEAPSRPFDAPSRLPSMVIGKKIAPLPGTKLEADMLRRLFPDAAIYTGQQAQEGIVKRDAGLYRYLHFATHGFFNDAAPMLSSIVLAAPNNGNIDGNINNGKEDGFLTAREISELTLTADMVVLSACKTAQGEVRSGEGVIGLSWALLVAGCPTQVVSQWSVSDASTATLMTDFYGNFLNGVGQARQAQNRNGVSKSAALSMAAATLRNDRIHGHPYYWAPFILIGDWR